MTLFRYRQFQQTIARSASHVQRVMETRYEKFMFSLNHIRFVVGVSVCWPATNLHLFVPLYSLFQTFSLHAYSSWCSVGPLRIFPFFLFFFQHVTLGSLQLSGGANCLSLLSILHTTFHTTFSKILYCYLGCWQRVIFALQAHDRWEFAPPAFWIVWFPL